MTADSWQVLAKFYTLDIERDDAKQRPIVNDPIFMVLVFGKNFLDDHGYLTLVDWQLTGVS